MADNDLYWRQIGSKQDAVTARARENSPVTLQVPATGQELVLERTFLPARQGATETVRKEMESVAITMVPTSVVTQADTVAVALAFGFVIFFRLAVKRLHASFELLTVVVFLITAVLLELVSTSLAATFLKAGLWGVVLVGIWSGCRWVASVFRA